MIKATGWYGERRHMHASPMAAPTASCLPLWQLDPVCIGAPGRASWRVSQAAPATREQLVERVVEHFELSGFQIDEARQVMTKRPGSHGHG
jgi:hypothetical protein